MSINEFLLNNPEGSLFSNIFPLEPPSLMPSLTYITALSSRLEHLSIEVNIQSLRIEVERAKRQKMRYFLKQLKREEVSPCPDAMPLRQKITTLQDNQNTIS